MLEFTLRRITATIPVLLGIIFVIFSVLYLIPGDPAEAIAGPRANKAAIERIRKEMGLKGREKIEQQFDRQIVVEAYLEEINKQ